MSNVKQIIWQSEPSEISHRRFLHPVSVDQIYVGGCSLYRAIRFKIDNLYQHQVSNILKWSLKSNKEHEHQFRQMVKSQLCFRFFNEHFISMHNLFCLDSTRNTTTRKKKQIIIQSDMYCSHQYTMFHERKLVKNPNPNPLSQASLDASITSLAYF